MGLLRRILGQSSRRAKLAPEYHSSPCHHDWRELPEMTPRAQAGTALASATVAAHAVSHNATIDNWGLAYVPANQDTVTASALRSVASNDDIEPATGEPFGSMASDDQAYSSSSSSFEDDDIFERHGSFTHDEINPATGLPMTGVVDVAGNLYGFGDSLGHSDTSLGFGGSVFDHSDGGFGSSTSWD